ncbi:copper-transporting P-type ATPase [Lactobacillus selangorensis]|uniref:P-type Cu(+) transporter n=2 Tax=Lactobacillus selangorensis TaxID=81857 RepID=A0A0R2FID3_9LACO|nr:copper-transporting P-type ATPase [Lactobacillus selangorensis]KRN31926.1 copper-transporting P-type ATPase [Lactobacillus selangorensis]
MGHGDMQNMHMDHGKMDMTHDSGQMSDMMNMGGHMMHMGNLKKKFWISLIVTIPMLFLSPMMGSKPLLSFPGADWINLILGTFLFFYGGKPFIQGARMEMKDRKPAMMSLITLGISVSYLYSIYAFIENNFINPSGHIMDYMWELATLIDIMLLGHWLEMRSISNAGSAVKKIAELLPDTAHVVGTDGKITDVPLSQLKNGQSVVVNAGEKIPADGTVTAGSSAVNESLVTGESKAVPKKVADKVIGGSTNGDGSLTVKVSGTGSDSYLAQVSKLVAESQNQKSDIQGVADKVASWLFYFALGAGIITFFVWLPLDGFAYALQRMVTVLVIACPHALGLAIPLVIARSTSLGATHGLLVRNRNAIEEAKQITYVLMDKTGTLTQGNFKVNEVTGLNGTDKKTALSIMAALENHSSHPLAIGVLKEAQAEDVDIPVAENVNTLKGIGLTGTVHQHEYAIVTANYLKQHHIKYDAEQFEQLASAGNSVSYLISDNEVIGLVAQGDQIKPGAQNLVKTLKQHDITPVMLTGDNQETAAGVAKTLGITDFHAELLPDDKEKIVAQYQSQGKHVMMVGDGVNDAPALAKANIGVAIGAGTDVAIDSADVVLVRSDPADILNFMKLAKRTNKKMIQNLWWGAGYNIVAIPLAAGVLAPIGIILSPAVGAVLMGASTIIVAANALTLNMKGTE